MLNGYFHLTLFGYENRIKQHQKSLGLFEGIGGLLLLSPIIFISNSGLHADLGI